MAHPIKGTSLLTGEDDIRFEEASHEVKPVFNKKCKNDSRHLILCFYSNFSLL